MVPVFVPTRDRPEELRGCLEALVQHLVLTGLECEIVVLDDSRNTDAVTANSANLTEAARRTGWNIRRIGLPERRALAQQICATLDLDPARAAMDRAVHWALGLEQGHHPPLTPYGANRNAGLLLAAGSSYLSLDDDVRAEFSQLQEQYVTTMDVRSAAIGAGRGSHEGFCVVPLASAADLKHISIASGAYTLASLLRLVDSAAAHLALPGICGNRWYARAPVGHLAQGTLRDYSYSRSSTYKTAVRSGFALLQAPEPLTESSAFLSHCYAANAQSLLPPFPPMGRSEDLSFALLVRYLYPENTTVHLPCMVRHDLGPARPFSEMDFQETGVDFGTLTRLVVEHLLGTSIAPAGSFDVCVLGQRMQHLSTLAPADWNSLLRRLYLRHSGELIHRLEFLLTQHNSQPTYWARDVESYIALLREKAVDSKQALPQEFRGLLSPDEAATEHCRFIRAYGELLEYWPRIWGAAAALNRREQPVQHTQAVLQAHGPTA